MHQSELIGRHEPNAGLGVTLQDLYSLIGQIPRKVRDHAYPAITLEDGSILDVTGLAISQSDQAETYEFRIHITTTVVWRPE